MKLDIDVDKLLANIRKSADGARQKRQSQVNVPATATSGDAREKADRELAKIILNRVPATIWAAELAGNQSAPIMRLIPNHDYVVAHKLIRQLCDQRRYRLPECRPAWLKGAAKFVYTWLVDYSFRLNSPIKKICIVSLDEGEKLVTNEFSLVVHWN